MSALQSTPPSAALNLLRKCPTGIPGLDEITQGGLPAGRPTLVAGAAGCGKTMLGMEFLVNGALQFGEPGLFVSFEEREQDLVENFASRGFDLPALAAARQVIVDHVYLERSEIEEAGDFDLEGLFIRLGAGIRAIGARRVVLDTIEALFSGFSNERILRAELRRLFRWLKEQGVTAVITGERGERSLTRHGLEEYVADCVILLDHRVEDQVFTRRLRIVKYRGSAHGSNEYPYLIDREGTSILPVTSLGLDHAVSTERISTGVPHLDAVVGGEGVYRGSTVMVSGAAGTGKSSLAFQMAAAAGGRGERVLAFLFEESSGQIVRNLRSIGLDLEPLVTAGLLQFQAVRPTLQGLEAHLAVIHRHLARFQPRLVIMDPISAFDVQGNSAARAMILRLVDSLKAQQITALFTSLSHDGSRQDEPSVGISSLVDTWIWLRNQEFNGERNRSLTIMKSRGIAHSNQIREYLLTDHGIELREVYTGPEAVLLGTARSMQEARDEAARLTHQQTYESRQRAQELKRRELEAMIELLRAEYAAAVEQTVIETAQYEREQAGLHEDRRVLAEQRRAEPEAGRRPNGRKGAQP